VLFSFRLLGTWWDGVGAPLGVAVTRIGDEREREWFCSADHAELLTVGQRLTVHLGQFVFGQIVSVAFGRHSDSSSRRFCSESRSLDWAETVL